MRYYPKLRADAVKHVEEICSNPCFAFSTDFIYYLTALHDVAWSPIESRPGPYIPHPKFPCTNNVEKAMQQILAKSALDYKLLYEELVPTEAENKLELFIDRAKRILSTMTDSPMDVFFALLHLGRWTVTFYKNGTRDTAYLAPYLMADALKKILENSSIPLWFEKFDEISVDLAGLLINGFANGFVEETYRFFEELDTGADDFDECTMCVCGECEDLSEGSYEWEEESGEYPPDIYQDNDLSGEYEDSKVESEEFSEDAEDEENKGAA